MPRLSILRIISCWLLLALVCCQVRAAERLPNLVILFADDLGYGDLSCYGNQQTATPHIDQLAKQGTRFTDFYVAQAVCGASRTALLTGCYPNRLGMLGAPGPKSKTGINDAEMLLSELCRAQGYATAIFGKWHLGDNQQFLPLQHGFDRYFGLPYSNDMWPFHPQGGNYPPLPLIDQNKIINDNVKSADQELLTKQYTEHAVEFIQANKARPFLLYVPYAMPHVPLHVSTPFRGKSKQGLFGDVLLELDWSVGQIMAALDQAGVTDNTLVMFSSDNGPWLSYGNHAGSAGPLREGKGTAWDGGVRVPCVMRWPKQIPDGRVCSEPLMTIDILPTWSQRINGKLPEHPIDGRDVWPILSGSPNAVHPQQAYYFYWGNELHAIRSGDWKLHFPHNYRSLKGKPGGVEGKPAAYQEEKTELALYNLRTDQGEQQDLSKQQPEVVARLQKLADQARSELGDALTKSTGTGRRPIGRLPEKTTSESR